MRGRVFVSSVALGLALCAAGWWLTRPREVAALLVDDDSGADTAVRDGAGDVLAARRGVVQVGAAVKPAKGRVEGDVRRAGVPTAARVTLFEVAKADPLTDPRWGSEAADVLVPTAEYLTAAPEASTEADATGAFVFPDVPAGTYDVVARSSAGGSGSERVVVSCEGALAVVHIQLRGGGPESLKGRVMHVDGRPFRGFVCPYTAVDEVAYFPRDASPVAVEEDGRFVLTGLDAGPVTVLAFVPGSFVARSHTVVLPSGLELEIVVDASTHHVVGRVVGDKDGQPIAGATILTTLWSPSGLQYLQSRAVTDGEGRFAVEALSGLTWYLVEATGFASIGVNRWLPEGDGFEFRLLRTGRIVGRVTSKVDGSPVEGVPVYAIDGRERAGPHATSKPDGRYELADVAPGDVTVVAFGAGYVVEGFAKATGRYNPCQIPLEPGATANLDLVVSRAARATGKVVGPTGLPVSGARVEWKRQLPGGTEDSVFGFLSSAQAVATTPQGAFAIETLAPGFSYEFKASSPGTSEGKAGPIRVEAERPNEIEIKLGAARFADVLVRLRGGGPIAGVNAYVYSHNEDNNWQSHGNALTDSNGIARLGPLPAGPMSFGAWSDGFRSGEDATEGGPPGNTDTVHAELVLERAFAVAGTVQYVDGSAFGEVVVELQGRSEDANQSQTDAEGNFRFTGLEDETFDLRVKLDWGAEAIHTVRTKSGEEHLKVVVKSAKKERLVVHVTDGDGKAVGQASYRMLQQTGSNTNSDDGTLQEGRLQVGLPETEWFLFVYGARASGGGPLPLGPAVVGPIAAKTKELDVRLPPEERIEGVVRAPDGHGVRGVRVSATFLKLEKPFENSTFEAAAARTDERGRFKLGGLGVGSYQVQAVVGGSYGAMDPVESKSGRMDLVLTLKVGDSAQPIVLDADGKPVVAAYVKATLGDAVFDSDTDDEGRAILEGLDAKLKYTLVVQAPHARSDVLNRTIINWTPSSDPIVLSRGLRLSGVVRDADGQPAVDAEVRVQHPTGGGFRTSTSTNGTFELRRVPEGEVTLTATMDGPPKRIGRPIKVLSGATNVLVTLDMTAELSIHVESAQAIPDDTYARLRDEALGDTDWEILDSKGHATFTGLRPASKYTVSVEVEFEGAATSHVAIATGIQGDAKSIELKLIEGLTVRGTIRSPVGTKNLRVSVTTSGEGRSGSVEEDGRFVVNGLFAGMCDVHASGQSPTGQSLRATVKVEAGGSVDLDLDRGR